MKVFIAGGSGVIGRRLVPLLLAKGHEVAAMSRSHDTARGLSELGAEPILADGLDRAAVLRAVARARLAVTNRLRTEGTDYLLEGARAAGVRRVIAQSYGLWGTTSGGGGTKGADSDVPATMRRTFDAIRHVESTVPEAECIEGLVVRYGFFYGPGTGIAADGEPSSATAPESGRSCTSTTLPPRRSQRSSAARQASTMSSTTSPLHSGCGCRSSPRRSRGSNRVT